MHTREPTVWGKAIKHGLLLLILALGGYLLLPPGEGDGSDGDAGESGERDSADVRYVIRFSVGATYQPGARPFGIGEPLKGLAMVVADFEKRYPDTRVEVVNTPGVREYLVTQLSSGAAPDIVNVNVEDVWVDTQKDWYIPLDRYLEAPNPFVVEKGDPNLPGARQWWDMFTYQAISRGKAAPDGKNYCLSLDMIETGIFYNKTLFDRLGLVPPRDWEEFIAICEAIERYEGFDREVTPLLMNLSAFMDWCQDLIFDQLYYDLLPGIDLKQDPSREAYLQGYLDPEEIAYLHEKGYFTEHDPRYREVWRIMKDLRRHTNRDLEGVDHIREFVNQRGAMLWSVSALVYRFSLDKNMGFEWGVFYLPKFTKKTSPYASDVEMCVIGGSASQFEITSSAVGDTPDDWPMQRRIDESQRLQRVVALLQFLSLPEQAERVINEYPCLIPNIVGVEPRPELADFVKILERRYTTTKWTYSFDLRFTDILRRMLGLYLTDGGITLDEFLSWQVRNLRSSCIKMVQRKQINLSDFDKKWAELAAQREQMTDLPAPPPAQ